MASRLPPGSLTIPDHAATTTTATIESTALGDLPPDLLADSSFDARYEMRDTLGEGGMGLVRACVDRRIGREIAIKSVRSGKGSRGGAGIRFLREACVQGQLEHPAIVPVYDLGRDADGTLYFTMKRVRGVTFEHIIDALRAGDEEAVRQFTRRKLLGAFANVCLAVDFAHARGVVHRDLKPGNVMLGDFGEVYVLDWGLAKVVGDPDPRLASGPPVASGSDPGAKTVVGATMGTPGYMSPEQARGAKVDLRTDVYALGAILFELLALEPLHDHTTPEVARESTLAGADARPSVRSPRLDVPPELDAVCVRATQRTAEDRYGTARELVDAVERYLDGDRDLARRRELAREHGRAAKELAARVLGGESNAEPLRAQALHEVGRAIALDPSNEDAVETLMRLMTSPPAKMPAGARAALQQETRNSMRLAGTIATITYLLWFTYLPLMLWMGVRSWTMWGVQTATWLLAAAGAYHSSRNPSGDGKPSPWLWIPATVGVSLTATFFGPYVLVPILAVMGSMLLHIAPARSHRPLVVLLNCLAVAVPAGLELTGVLPPSYVVRDGSIQLVPAMLDLPPVQTHAFLLFASMSLVVTSSVIMGRFRETITRIETKMHVQAWQLQQLVPEQARPASAVAGTSDASTPAS
jgi:serine/threonine-protein kinase